VHHRDGDQYALRRPGMRFFAFVLLAPLAAAAGDAAKGKELALARIDGGCLLCHAIPGADRPAGIGSRLDAAQLAQRIEDAARFNPDTVMPPYGRSSGLYGVAPRYRGKPLLTPQQIDALAAFLATLK